jgi:ATP synthase protein I
MRLIVTLSNISTLIIQEKSKLTNRNLSSRAEPKGRAFALEMVAAQIVFSLGLSLIGLAHSTQAAIAILSGGMICSLANLWLAIAAFRPALGKPPGQMLAAFYSAEIGKFIIVAVLFLIAFKKTTLLKQPLNALLMFATYALVQCTAWAYPLARSTFLNIREARQR